MGNGFWLAVGQMCQLCFWTVRYLPRGNWRQLPRRTLMFGLTIPVLIVFQMLHWLGFALDEILFRRYRKVSVTKPIFVTGIPRSGTTHLHRVLARHDQLTSMQTWECALAPSISERYFYRFAAKLLSPVGLLFKRLPISFFQKMDAIHQLGLNEAEEDFIALLPINACFLLVVLFPEAEQYWRLSQFDKSMSETEKRRILKFYHRMLQKHLAFHGERKRYLCKNPSFMMWVKGLSQQYPDASFVICEREADKTVPSQLSSLQPTWKAFYGEPMSDAFSEKIVNMLAGYYHYLDVLPLEEVNAMRLPMSALVSDLNSAVNSVMDHCEIPMTQNYRAVMNAEVHQARQYQSQHQYIQADMFNWQTLKPRFPAQFLRSQPQ